jgi:hypothetical protein
VEIDNGDPQNGRVIDLNNQSGEFPNPILPDELDRSEMDVS